MKAVFYLEKIYFEITICCFIDISSYVWRRFRNTDICSKKKKNEKKESGH